ncbi:hypothetical protein WR25_10364 [Diploscapter pachys]|uniref:Degenerin n=1 Tax=Diploscapter pachys TaxID=2018661 RepID=A0A2A2JH99_9BILA|nr:hypothetical protein WR25_10364 [Diploscapter pachys]
MDGNEEGGQIAFETPEVVQNRRNRSTEQSIGKRSSMYSGRQASEDSRNIRFVDKDIILPATTMLMAPIERQDSRRGSFDLKSFARRFSVNPDYLRRHGLTKIRVRGHLDWDQMIHRFERQSTFHGVCHAANAPNRRWRIFWYMAFAICLTCLLLQIFFIISRYLSYAKTVDLDLKFKNAPFPSITLCNLNPYKLSAVNANPTTRAMLDAYARRIGSGDKREGIASAITGKLISRVRRQKRKTARRRSKARYLQAFAQCLCDVNLITGERKGSCFGAYQGKIAVQLNESVRTFGNLQPSRCLCQLDMVSKTLWPCFPYNSWKEKLCAECVDGSGHCPMRFYKGNEQYEKIKDQVDLCLCHREYNHCVQTREDSVILEIDPNDELDTLNVTQRAEWQKQLQKNIPTTTTTTEAPEIAAALGFDDEEIKDDIAIVAKAQENLMFTVGEMSSGDKEKMSYDLDEFVLKCMFNQKDCDMPNDFKLHYDNTYGNCFTFNHNRTAEVTSHRAGANYGLRVLLYANVSEYLPTSEAVGFRITVHDKNVAPFPDAFGYSAPTGFMSSFGVRMKQFIRLEPPHGQCKKEANKTLTYEGFSYSVEACHRLCAQHEIIKKCSCADPNYPIPKQEREEGIDPCHATNNKQRECLKNTTLAIGEIYAKNDEGIPDCKCHQPCHETNYEVTYSAARWPSGSAKVMECKPGEHMCLEKYRVNAAMVQIFYEELNYETLSESEAYSITSVLADIGGMTGLWIGASVISLLELFALFVFATQAYVKKKKEEKAAASGSQPQLLLPSKSNSSKNSQASRKTSKSSQNSKNRLSIQDIKSIKSNHSSKSRNKATMRVHQEQMLVVAIWLLAKNFLVYVNMMKWALYGLSNSDESNREEGEGDGEGEREDEVHKEEPYYDKPFERRSTRRHKGDRRHKAGVEGHEGEASGLIASAEKPPEQPEEGPTEPGETAE